MKTAGNNPRQRRLSAAVGSDNVPRCPRMSPNVLARKIVSTRSGCAAGSYGFRRRKCETFVPVANGGIASVPSAGTTSPA